MARPSDKISPMSALIVAALAPVARAVAASGNAIDMLALNNAVAACEYLARWANDTTETNRRNAYARAFACSEVASIESADLATTIRRETLTAHANAVRALCDANPARAMAYAQSAQTLAARL